MAIYIQKLGYKEELMCKFVCIHCNCEWLANIEETYPAIDEWNHPRDNTHTMDCPCCGEHVVSSKGLKHWRYLSPIDPRVEVLPLTGP